MRKQFLTLLTTILFASLCAAQSETKFYVEVSATEVRAGASFEVKYILQNGSNGQFMAPNWESTPFYVTNTSQSSSFSLSNGRSTAEAVYHYRVVARDTGWVEIPRASFVTGNGTMQTETTKIRVLPGDGNSVITAPDKRRPAPSPAAEPKKKIKTIRL